MEKGGGLLMIFSLKDYIFELFHAAFPHLFYSCPFARDVMFPTAFLLFPPDPHLGLLL